MTASAGERGKSIVLATQCAATLTAVLAVVGFVGWVAGLASLADIGAILTGVFTGSLLMGITRPDRRKASRRGISAR